MKSLIRYTSFAMMLMAALTMQVHAASTPGTAPAAAAAPATHTYPSVLPLTLQVGADKANELRTLRELTITAQREGEYAPTIVLGPVAPFSAENLCTNPMPAGLAGCLVNDDSTVGTLRVNWQVPEAGTYRFVLSGKRGTSERIETIGAFDLEARD